MRWIKCSEQMPEINTQVIYCDEFMHRGSARYIKYDFAKTEKGRAPRFEDLRGVVHGVTHWMPLPTPPTE